MTNKSIQSGIRHLKVNLKAYIKMKCIIGGEAAVPSYV